MRSIFIALTSLLFFTSCNSSEKKISNSEENSSHENNIEENPKLDASIKHGKEIYTNFCVSCHLPNGKGMANVFPPLAQSDYLMNKRKESIRAIKYGQSGAIIVNGKTYNSVMTPLGLDDQEIADVMNYITNSWGNTNETLITEQEVSEIEE